MKLLPNKNLVSRSWSWSARFESALRGHKQPRHRFSKSYAIIPILGWRCQKRWSRLKAKAKRSASYVPHIVLFINSRTLINPGSLVLLFRLGYRRVSLWTWPSVRLIRYYTTLVINILPLLLEWSPLAYSCVTHSSWITISTRKWKFLYDPTCFWSFIFRLLIILSAQNLQPNVKWPNFTPTSMSNSSAASPQAIWIHSWRNNTNVFLFSFSWHKLLSLYTPDNVGDDCPVFDGLFEYCSISAGGQWVGLLIYALLHWPDLRAIFRGRRQAQPWQMWYCGKLGW